MSVSSPPCAIIPAGVPGAGGGALSAGLYICVGLVGAHVSHLIRPARGISASGPGPLSDSSVCHTLKLC